MPSTECLIPPSDRDIQVAQRRLLRVVHHAPGFDPAPIPPVSTELAKFVAVSNAKPLLESASVIVTINAVRIQNRTHILRKSSLKFRCCSIKWLDWLQGRWCQPDTKGERNCSAHEYEYSALIHSGVRPCMTHPNDQSCPDRSTLNITLSPTDGDAEVPRGRPQRIRRQLPEPG